MDILNTFMDYWWLLLILLAIAISFSAFYHIVTTKHDVRSAIGWSGVVWLAPFLGALFYFLFGINRIERKALRVMGERGEHGKAHKTRPRTIPSNFPHKTPMVRAHVKLMDSVCEWPFVGNNRVNVLVNGNEAFEAMLDGIAQAKKTIGLQTFIFDYDRAGKQFLDALKKAHERGVEVRVLVDSVGALYHRPSILRVLRRAGIPAARFNQSLVPWRMTYLNLRNHRKILVIDGKKAFTGGMNIREGNYEDSPENNAIRDIHFFLEGPIVAQLSEIFAQDWGFSTDEELNGPQWFSPDIKRTKSGKAFARGIPDGPDEDIKKTRWAIVSALGMAQKSVKIMTPYFLPDRVLVSALNQTALRGVAVDILLPEKNNLFFVQWASKAQYGQVLEGGCRVYHTPGTFDHSKIMIVDDKWFLLGSTNWDPRSLRLNFEFNVEVFEEILAGRLSAMVEKKKALVEPVTLEKWQKTPKLQRAMQGWIWLFSPYL